VNEKGQLIDPLASAEWERVHEAVSRFEAAWGRGERPGVADYWSGGQPLLLELAQTDLEYRLKAGEPARAEDYLGAFPALAADAAAASQLVAAEYRLRRRLEPGLTPAEYVRRFPGRGPSLHEALGPAPQGPEQSTIREGGGGPAPVGFAAPPGYELLDELGRGGMGVVYKARQFALNRVVALKTLPAADHADPEALARFRSEAAALARLQHPNIVQVFEVGEHDGRTFFALEFVEGGSLARRLAAAPLPAAEAAALAETLARAVHAAHRREIVHRDLKPANVLLAADGAPKVTDFGLAKRLDADSGLSRTGQVVGTPSYMPPEQAAGRTREVGPSADVYALGAILYECLTGRPPFKAATALATLEQVVRDEPAPPRRLQPDVPRDLETICLKCLHKDPGRRYADAAALADDLSRFRKGEPVTARPVGSWERAAKWVRRRPAVAAFLALFVVSLVTGTGVSLYLAAVASDRAGKLGDELGKNRALLQESREQRADGLLRAFGTLNGADRNELNALWDLATMPESQAPVRTLFITRALLKPETAEQFERSAPRAIRAAVGLDARRRRHVLAQLRPRLNDGGADLRVRTACAAAVAQLAPPEPRFAGEAAAVLIEAMTRSPETGSFVPLARAETLAALAPRLDEAEAAAAARQIVGATTRHSNPLSPLFLTDGFCAIAPRMETADRRQAADALGRRIADETSTITDNVILPSYDNAFAAVAPYMDEAAAHQVADAITRRHVELWSKGDTQAFVNLITPGGEYGWYRVAPWLDAAGATRAAQKFLDGMDRGGNSRDGIDLVPAFAAVVPRLDDAGAASAAQRVLDRWRQAPEAVTAAGLADWFEAIAPRMDKEGARQVADEFGMKAVDAMVTRPNVGTAPLLASSLGAIAPYMSETAIEAASRKTLDALARTPDPSLATILAGGAGNVSISQGWGGLQGFGPNVPGLTGRIANPSPIAVPLFTMNGAKPRPAGLAALLPRLDGAAAQNAACEAARRILDLVRQSRNPLVAQIVAPALEGFVPRMDEATADLAGETILATLIPGPGASSPGVGGPSNLAGLPLLLSIAPRMSRSAADAAGRKLKTALKDADPTTLLDVAAAFPDRSPPKGGPAADSAVAQAPESKEAHGAAVEALRKYLDRSAGLPSGRPPVLGPSMKPGEPPPAFGPLVSGLDPQEMVDLLKQPTCVGAAQEVILSRLGEEKNQKFATLWDLVEWVEAHDPSIDLRTPPHWPEPDVQNPPSGGGTGTFNPIFPGPAPGAPAPGPVLPFGMP
jgi:hypothetical protein